MNLENLATQITSTNPKESKAYTEQTPQKIEGDLTMDEVVGTGVFGVGGLILIGGFFLTRYIVRKIRDATNTAYH